MPVPAHRGNTRGGSVTVKRLLHSTKIAAWVQKSIHNTAAVLLVAHLRGKVSSENQTMP